MQTLLRQLSKKSDRFKTDLRQKLLLSNFYLGKNLEFDTSRTVALRHLLFQMRIFLLIILLLRFFVNFTIFHNQKFILKLKVNYLKIWIVSDFNLFFDAAASTQSSKHKKSNP